MKSIKLLSSGILMLSVVLLMQSCKKDDDHVGDPHDDHEHELITTVKLIFTDVANPGVTQTFSYRDIDGVGGNAPTIDTIALSPNKQYNVEVLLLDESKSVIDTISNEVLEEANDHLFVFNSPSSQLNITITDEDTNTPPLPLGLLSRWVTVNAADTQVEIILKHQPGIKNGDASRGESDIEILMPVKIR